MGRGAAWSPTLKILHQHKYLSLQVEEIALATIARFKFCMRTRKRARDWDPLAETLQSCEVLKRNFAMRRRPKGIPRKLTEEVEFCWSLGRAINAWLSELSHFLSFI